MDGRGLARKGLTEGGNDDDHELDTVYSTWSVNKEGWKLGRVSEYLHILLRPITSANQPKKSCPIKVPTGVATLTPRSWLTLSFPPEYGMSGLVGVHRVLKAYQRRRRSPTWWRQC